MFEVGDRVYYTTRDDSTYSEGFGTVIGISENPYDDGLGGSIRFSGDDGKTFIGSEGEFVPVPEFELGDWVEYTYALDSDAEYFGVSGEVIIVEDDMIFIDRDDDEGRLLGGGHYEFTLLDRLVDPVTPDSVFVSSWDKRGWTEIGVLDAEPEFLSDDNDPVTAPAHYRSLPNGIECIDVIQFFNFPVGSAIKYLWRHDLKGDPIENLRKAIQNIEFEINRRQGL